MFPRPRRTASPSLCRRERSPVQPGLSSCRWSRLCRQVAADPGFIMSGNKNHRCCISALGQVLLHLQAVHLWHLDVEYDAFDAQPRHALDEVNEFLPRDKRVGLHRAHEPFERPTNGFIVIHDGNEWRAFFRDAPLLCAVVQTGPQSPFRSYDVDFNEKGGSLYIGPWSNKRREKLRVLSFGRYRRAPLAAQVQLKS